MTELKQSTIEEMVETEKALVLEGTELFGDFFDHAAEWSLFLHDFIDKVDDLNKFMSLMFVGQIRKHHKLALFSFIRRHHVQGGMNMRQVLEAGAWAAYGMAFSEPEKFSRIDEDGKASCPKKLKEARDKWLNDNFKTKSDEMRTLKKTLNESTAHANAIYSFERLKMKPIEDPGFEFPFFDPLDEYRIKMDLLFVANTAFGLIDLFNAVNNEYKPFVFCSDFLQRFQKLTKEHDRLRAEVSNEPRFIAVAKENKPKSQYL